MKRKKVMKAKLEQYRMIFFNRETLNMKHAILYLLGQSQVESCIMYTYLCSNDCKYFQAQLRQDMVKEMKNDFEEDRKKLKQVNFAILYPANSF